MRSQPRSQIRSELAERVKSILETRNLSIHRVSQESGSMFGHASTYFLPHHLYYELTVEKFRPSLYQLFSLSKISDYCMADWLRVFGFDLEQIPRLQILLPSKRTVLLDSSASDPHAWVPWFRNKSMESPIPSAAPLSQLLEGGPAVRQSSLFDAAHRHFLYVKIGQEDALAFPDLVPGSIARINQKLTDPSPRTRHQLSERLFLVEHSEGICCCRVIPRGRSHVLLVSRQLPYAQVDLQLHREGRIIGEVDLEIRPLIHPLKPEVPTKLGKRWKPEPLDAKPTLSRLLLTGRRRTALSMREASALSRAIATLLGDELYYLSASSLSDYEASDTAPRHVQKIISLCVVYAIPFGIFLDVVGLSDRLAGKDAIPDALIPRINPQHGSVEATEFENLTTGGFLEELVRRSQDIPWFLKNSLAEVSRVESPSLRSFFWLAESTAQSHRYLDNALLISVDRRRQRPVDSRSCPVWEQMLYLVLERNGAYRCGPCGVENGTLIMHPDPERSDLRKEFRNRRDAEVVGQICAVMRKL